MLHHLGKPALLTSSEVHCSGAGFKDAEAAGAWSSAASNSPASTSLYIAGLPHLMLVGAAAMPPTCGAAPSFASAVVSLAAINVAAGPSDDASRGCDVDMQQAGSDADSEGVADTLPLHALAAVRHALAATLAASSSGCKDWARDHASAAGVEQLADVQVQAQLSGKRAGRGGKHACASAPADGAGASASSAARQWWDQRRALDDMLAERVNELAAVVAPALQQCLPDEGSAQARCRGPQDAASGGAVLLLLGNDLHALPWEALPVLQGRPVYRLLHDQHAPLAPHQVLHVLGQDAEFSSTRSAAKALQAAIPGAAALEAVDVAQAVYVVDPKGDLAQTRARFEPWFAALPGWQGSAGAPALPSPQLLAELARKELFVFLGHGAGVFRVCKPQLPDACTRLQPMRCKGNRM